MHPQLSAICCPSMCETHLQFISSMFVKDVFCARSFNCRTNINGTTELLECSFLYFCQQRCSKICRYYVRTFDAFFPGNALIFESLVFWQKPRISTLNTKDLPRLNLQKPPKKQQDIFKTARNVLGEKCRWTSKIGRSGRSWGYHWNVTNNLSS